MNQEQTIVECPQRFKHRAGLSELRSWPELHLRPGQRTIRLLLLQRLEEVAVGPARRHRLSGDTTCSDRKRTHSEARDLPSLASRAPAIPSWYTFAPKIGDRVGGLGQSYQRLRAWAIRSARA